LWVVRAAKEPETHSIVFLSGKECNRMYEAEEKIQAIAACRYQQNAALILGIGIT